MLEQNKQTNREISLINEATTLKFKAGSILYCGEIISNRGADKTLARPTGVLISP